MKLPPYNLMNPDIKLSLEVHARKIEKDIQATKRLSPQDVIFVEQEFQRRI